MLYKTGFVFDNHISIPTPLEDTQELTSFLVATASSDAVFAISECHISIPSQIFSS